MTISQQPIILSTSGLVLGWDIRDSGSYDRVTDDVTLPPRSLSFRIFITVQHRRMVTITEPHIVSTSVAWPMMSRDDGQPTSGRILNVYVSATSKLSNPLCVLF